MKPFNLTTSRAKKRAMRQQAVEERVSLIDQLGKPTPAPEQRQKTTGISAYMPRNMSRIMRYVSLTAVSAMMTFFVLGRESKVLHWEEYNKMLEPQLKGGRCYNEGRHHEDERCTCPDPTIPLFRTDPRWIKQHDNMVTHANRAPKDLDVVFVGDSITERWNGTKSMGTKELRGFKAVFDQRFTKAGGGDLEGIALGCAGDTGPSLLWHVTNGMVKNLNPKIWFINIGTNDLFIEKCTDRFVIANILNVVKTIFEMKPDASFVIHGILPRKDNPDSKSQFLKKKWKYAQAINTQLRKFCEHSARLYYMQAGALFLEETESKGRRQIDRKLLEDGIHPTKRGMEVWGDYIVKRVHGILQDIEERKQEGLTETTRRLRDVDVSNFTIW